MNSRDLFSGIHWKKSYGNGNSFPRLSIKARSEVVTLKLGDEDFTPLEVTGKPIYAEELHAWIHSDKEFYIVDMRNDYEFKVGHFKGSITLPGLKNFRDLPEVMPELESLKDKTVVTVCTGGIRCEKASGFLVKYGFKDVYKLYGGIVTYMEKYPNEDFLGKLYVFDGRITMGFNVDSEKHQVIGKCDMCQISCEKFADYWTLQGQRVHGILCDECYHSGKVKIDEGFMIR